MKMCLIIQTVSSKIVKKKKLSISEQQMPISATAFAQADQGILLVVAAFYSSV